VLVLPQRQTALVAKQAAEVDVLSGGRLRLGVGLGWNPVEYGALGMNFGDRAARYEEQIELLRLLWTQRSVTFHGRYEHVDAAGLLPMPVQQPIPIWMGGGTSRPVLERIGRIGDGWMCTAAPGYGLEEAVEIIHAAAIDAGRDPSEIGLQGGVMIGAAVDRDRIRRHLDKWERAGASHAVISAIGSGRSPQQHIDVIHEAASAALDR
jgi:probable F420-dependent oxidoreductase